MSNIRQAQTNRLHLAEHRRQVFAYDASAGTQVSDLEIPAYWQLLALSGRVNPWDLIEVREENGAWWVLCIVKHVSPEGLEVMPIKGVQTETVGPKGAATPLGAEFSVQHRGTHHKWCAMRGTEILKDGFESQVAASQYLVQYAKTAKAAA